MKETFGIFVIIVGCCYYVTSTTNLEVIKDELGFIIMTLGAILCFMKSK